MGLEAASCPMRILLSRNGTKHVVEKLEACERAIWEIPPKGVVTLNLQELKDVIFSNRFLIFFLQMLIYLDDYIIFCLL